MAKSTVKLDRRVTTLLNRLPDDCTAMLKRSIEESGTALYDAMVQRVPERTGKLRESIGLKYSSSGLVTFVGFSKREFPAEWKKAGWRAHFTEFGTKGTSGGGGGGRRSARVRRAHAATRAQPFVLPALIEEGPLIIELTKDAVDQALKNASEGAGSG
jgi:HK97 gp10 family phage protein